MLVKTFWKIGCLTLVLLLTSCATKQQVGAPAATSASVTSLLPVHAEIYRDALSKLQNQQPKEAEKLLKGLLRQRTDVPELWLNLAYSQYQQNKWSEAEKTIQKVLIAFPKIPQAHNLAGILAVEQGKFKAAEKHYVDALQLNAAYGNALYNMALLQDIYLQNVASAVQYYNRYLETAQDDEATKAWVENLSRSLGGAQ